MHFFSRARILHYERKNLRKHGDVAATESKQDIDVEMREEREKRSQRSNNQPQVLPTAAPRLTAPAH